MEGTDVEIGVNVEADYLAFVVESVAAGSDGCHGAGEGSEVLHSSGTPPKKRMDGAVAGQRVSDDFSRIVDPSGDIIGIAAEISQIDDRSVGLPEHSVGTVGCDGRDGGIGAETGGTNRLARVVNAESE